MVTAGRGAQEPGVPPQSPKDMLNPLPLLHRPLQAPREPTFVLLLELAADEIGKERSDFHLPQVSSPRPSERSERDAFSILGDFAPAGSLKNEEEMPE